MNAPRWLARLAILLSAVTLLSIAWLLLVAEPRFSVFSLAGDDTGYYFHLARNACLGYGFSFDRHVATNGFNPLCAWLLIGVYRVFGGALAVDTCYRLGVLLSLLAMLASVAGLVRLLRDALAGGRLSSGARSVLVAAAVALYVMFVATKSYYGMDAPFVLVFGVWYLVRVQRAGLLAAGVRAAIVDGALLALIFLARVDTLPLLVGAFGLMVVLGLGRPAAWARVLGRGAIVAAVVAPYFIWSFAHFGTWLPISARIKSAFPHASLGRSLAAIRHSSLNAADQASFLVAGIMAVLVCAWLVARLRRGASPDALLTGRTGVLALLSCYLVMRFGFMLLFSRNDVQGSYAILAHVLNLLAVVVAADVGIARAAASPPAAERLASAVAAVVLLAGLGLFAGKLGVTLTRWNRLASGVEIDDATLGREIGAHTRPSDVLFGGAFGIAGFFADRAWINGDGVINTLEYQERIRDGRLREYLASRGVNHVVFTLAPGTVVAESIRVEVPSGLFPAHDAYEVAASDIVLRRPVLRGDGGVVMLARIRP